jgi:alanine dehydrogenase
MDFGVPVERHHAEHRVGLTPGAAQALVDTGQRVFVESGAGAACRFSDHEYQAAGAEIVFRPEEVYRRAEVIVGVAAPTAGEIGHLSAGQSVWAFWHLAVAPRPLIDELELRKVTALSYELVADSDGRRPVLEAMSEIAGQLAIHTAAHLLTQAEGGRGVLLGAAAGLPPATVAILGAGAAGRAAAETGVGCGAEVIVLDRDPEPLRRLKGQFGDQIAIAYAEPELVARAVRRADAVIGAVLAGSDARTPFLVTREMVAAMRPGSVIIDLSIDQGGCFETSRPTTIDDPTYVIADVVHCCVPNLTAGVPRTASKALSNAHRDYQVAIGRLGIAGALVAEAALARSAVMYRGTVTREALASLLGRPYRPLRALLSRDAGV